MAVLTEEQIIAVDKELNSKMKAKKQLKARTKMLHARKEQFVMGEKKSWAVKIKLTLKSG